MLLWLFSHGSCFFVFTQIIFKLNIILNNKTMKKINLFAMSLLALLMVCFTACENKNFVEVDYSDDLVGTWTILEEGQAEAMVINPDGTFEVTGVMNGGNGSLYESKGTIKVVNNKVSLVFEGDDDVIEGRLELVAGKSMSIVINEEYDVRLTYDYCENDLSDEIVGMWVCNDGPTSAKGDMMIQVFNEDGSSVMTGHADELLVNDKSTTYKVVGDLVFLTMNKENVKYESFKMTYSPNGTAYGDIMTLTLAVNNANIAPTTTWLRVKESLNFTGQKYDYISSYVSNAKGKDEDITIMGHTFNMANIESGDLDAMFRSILSCLEVNANSIKYTVNYNGQDIVSNDPITVDGNKVTIDMGVEFPGLRKVDMYMFQDADDSQLHIYIPTSSFVNYFANLLIPTLAGEDKLDTADTAAVEKVFTDMEARVESINVSLVYKARN